MFGLGLATKIYIALDAIDMRKGFDGGNAHVVSFGDYLRRVPGAS